MFDDRGERFCLGRVVATANAISALDEGSIRSALRRHVSGDWGELDSHDLAVNEAALLHGGRLLSVFRDQTGTRFYVITESDRSVTTVLLPEDY